MTMRFLIENYPVRHCNFYKMKKIVPNVNRVGRQALDYFTLQKLHDFTGFEEEFVL